MTSAPSSKDFSVAIVGGGMVGLTCAIALSRAGLKVDLFESAKQFSEVGAGVTLTRTGLQALKLLGILDSVNAQPGYSKPLLDGFLFISGVGEHESVFKTPTQPDEWNMGLWRPAFVRAVTPLLDDSSVKIHFDKSCTHITKTPTIAVGGTSPPRTTLHFSDGTTHIADVVIGADGIRSTTRRYVTGTMGSASGGTGVAYTGSSMYRGLVNIEDLKKAGMKIDVTGRIISWFHFDKHLITYPLENNTILNVTVSARNTSPLTEELPGHWVASVPQEQMLREYEGWGRDVQLMLEHIKEPTKWYIHAVSPPLESYTRGRVVLVGDAAHAMLPHLGAGVNIGFEDAYTIYRLLTHPKTTLSNLEYVLELYNQARVPRGNMVLRRAAWLGEVYDEHETSGGDNNNLVKSLQDMWTPVWRYDVDKEVDALLARSGLGLGLKAKL